MIPQKKVISWFLTSFGKKCMFYAASTTCIGIVGVHFLPQTILLNKYKDIVQCYKNGFPVPVPDQVVKRFETALNLAEIEDVARPYYKPFSVFGFDIFSAGSGYSRYGGVVGIPTNFSYETEDDIDKKNLKVNNETVNWSSQEGSKLAKALVLSENAQIFAIARELAMLQSPKLYLDTLYPTSAFIFVYGVAQSTNQKMHLYSKPRIVRVIMYSLLGLFGFGMYSFLKDFTQVYYETQVDRYLKERSPILAEGGKEFYEKTLIRNIALRKLLGSSGESMYSVLGNENYFLRQKHTPLVTRKNFFGSAEHSAELN